MWDGALMVQPQSSFKGETFGTKYHFLCHLYFLVYLFVYFPQLTTLLQNIQDQSRYYKNKY